MGYPVDVAKKALLKTKNQGIIQALDIIQGLMEEEKQPSPRLIKDWTCQQCTYYNVNGSEKCEICLH